MSRSIDRLQMPNNTQEIARCAMRTAYCPPVESGDAYGELAQRIGEKAYISRPIRAALLLLQDVWTSISKTQALINPRAARIMHACSGVPDGSQRRMRNAITRGASWLLPWTVSSAPRKAQPHAPSWRSLRSCAPSTTGRRRRPGNAADNRATTRASRRWCDEPGHVS